MSLSDKEMVELLKTEVRVMSVQHTNKIARIRRKINEVLNYELAMAINMSECDEWDVSPKKMRGTLNDMKLFLENVTE